MTMKVQVRIAKLAAMPGMSEVVPVGWEPIVAGYEWDGKDSLYTPEGDEQAVLVIPSEHEAGTETDVNATEISVYSYRANHEGLVETVVTVSSLIDV